MAEIINLDEWKKLQEEKEIESIQEDIKDLSLEIASMVSEMESPLGPFLYDEEFLDAVPQLKKILTCLENYNER